MRVWIPTVGELRRERCITWGPSWGHSGELPVQVNEYPEGTLSYYGSGSAVVVMRALPIRLTLPISVVGGRLRLSWPGGRRQGDVMAIRKIASGGATAAATGPGIADRSSWPCLVEYLTSTSYPDGQPRETSSLIIVADASGWRGCVSDKDNGRTLWRTAGTLEALLLELESALVVDDPASWRQAGGGFKGKRKRA